jgi:hypothetical protein
MNINAGNIRKIAKNAFSNDVKLFFLPKKAPCTSTTVYVYTSETWFMTGNTHLSARNF